MSMLPVGIGSAEAGGYQIERSLRFNSADSAYLNRTPASAGNRKTWTWSAWVKRSDLVTVTQIVFGAYTSNADSLFIYFSNNQIVVGGYSTTYLVTTAVYRDPSAWYMVTLSVDTSQATASNRFKLYVNGTQVTAFAQATYPSQNTDLSVNATYSHTIGAGAGTPYYYSGYLTEINFIDGQALTPSSFGETDTDTGVWKPKAYSGSYGTNGFYLKFADNSGTTSTTLGKDSSGNGNNWTPNNFSVTAGAGNDSLVDTPTPYGTDTGVGGEVRGNYATWNPIYKDTTATTTATSNGNLDTTGQFAYSTIGFPSGKFYFECTVGSNNNQFIGVSTNPYAAANLRAYNKDGTYYTGSGWIAYGATYTTNDIIGVAIDMDSQTIQFYKNGSSQGQKTSIGLSGLTIFPMLYVESSGSVTVNFGQRPFAYTAPSGFKALVTTNLPEPTIKQGNQYFDATAYTGTGTALNVVNSGGMPPDFVWIKNRTNAYSHLLFDKLRGATTWLQSNDTSADQTNAQTLTSFNSNGFSVGTNISPNGSGNAIIAWQWRANGAGVTNTAGTITSTVSVNTTSGFSIVTYTGNNTAGATIGHGLGVAPSMIIVKSRNTAGTDWAVYHTSLGATQSIYLDLTSAALTLTGVWNNTAPTSSVFSVGGASASGSGDTNGSSRTYVAYCFAPVAGYSAFGRYTGNGSADGPFVYTGFRPRWVLLKISSGGTAPNFWMIYDTARNTSNTMNLELFPNSSSAEQNNARNLDCLSNGFKIRTSDNIYNASGNTYIYAAFAENPFKYSLAR